MKKYAFLSVVMLCLTTFAFTACLGDDDDNNTNKNVGLTETQKHSCYLSIAGEYSGKLYFYKEIAMSPEVDSVVIQCAVTNDTTLMMYNVPPKVFATLIPNESLKEAINAAEPVDVESRIAFFNASPIEFVLLPKTTTFNINYKEEEHKVNIAFLYGDYSWGSSSAAGRQLNFQTIEYGVYLDNSKDSELYSQAPLMFITK